MKAGSAVAGWQSSGRVVGDAYMIGDGVALALVRLFVAETLAQACRARRQPISKAGVKGVS